MNNKITNGDIIWVRINKLKAQAAYYDFDEPALF
jgi:hypothetical protein